jgi:hypothetical protein
MCKNDDSGISFVQLDDAVRASHGTNDAGSLGRSDDLTGGGGSEFFQKNSIQPGTPCRLLAATQPFYVGLGE